MNEISTDVKEMSIFKKIRLKLFIKRFKVSDNMMKKYNEAPDYIKNNPDVIDTIIDGIIEERITLHDATECPRVLLLKKLCKCENREVDYIFKNLLLEQKIEMIKCENELLTKLSDRQKCDIFIQAIQEEKYKYIEILKLGEYREQYALKLLKESWKDSFIENLQKILRYLSKDTIKKIIFKKNELINSLSYQQQKEYAEKYVGRGLSLRYFDQKIQKEYMKQHPDSFSDMSEELQIMYATQDKLNISRMDELSQIKMLQMDFKNIRYFDSKELPKNIKKYIGDMDFDTIKNIIVHTKLLDAVGCLCDVTFHFENFFVGNKVTYEQSVLNELSLDDIEELVKIDNNYALSYVSPFIRGGGFDDESVQRCKILFERMYGREKLDIFSKSIENIFSRSREWMEKKDTEEIPLAELKILFNSEIMAKGDVNIILDYFKKRENFQDGQEEFREIINEVYGKKALEILEYRSNLNVYNINSLEIFDSRILDNFSTEFVNDLISYNISGFSAFLDTIKNKDKLDNFIMYYDILAEIMGKNVETMQKAFNEFDYVEELLNDVKGKDLTEKQYYDLISVLCSNENKCNINNLEDLDNYEQLANEYLRNRLKQTKDSMKYSEIILEEILGITGRDAEYFTNLFDLSTDELKRSICTESEICLLNTLNFLTNNVTDIEVLRDFANSAMNTQGLRNPIALYTGMRKIRERQMEIFNSNFLTKEQMDIEISKLDGTEKDPPIYKYTDKNGIEHYCLNGIPFSCLTTRISFSGKKIAESEAIKRFLEYDGQRGASTVSCSFVKRWNK